MREKKARRGAGAVIALVIAVSLLLAGCSRTPDISKKSGLEKAAQETGAYLVKEVPDVSIGNMGGDWTIFALKKTGCKAADKSYYESYYDSVRGILKAQHGVIAKDSRTPYARVSMALKAIGKDPENVEGYDLLSRLDSYKNVKDQGINAEAFALIASNYCGYKLKNEKRYLNDILSLQTENGGISYDGTMPDEDISSMSLQALAFYNGKNARVTKAVKGVVKWLSSKQRDDGTYGNCESTAQVIIALGTLKEDPFVNKDFIKNGKSLADGLMAFSADGGAFSHKKDGDADLMATEQALTAMAAAEYGRRGKSVYENK
ncbi:MAG: hypothetical protein ACI4LM_03480 [Anaerovoracaceae bacterium]